MTFNTNISADTSARFLADSSAMLSKSLARLSSGSKIVAPSDDAAGLAVSTRFDAQINRTRAAVDNIGNAVSFSQTQDGFLQKVGKSLDRMSELAMLAQDTTKTNDDRKLYNQEFQTLASYITDIAGKTFNGVSLFSSSASNVIIDSDGVSFAMAGISASYIPGASAATPSTPPSSSTLLGNLFPAFTQAETHVLGPGVTNGIPDDSRWGVTSSNTLGDEVTHLNWAFSANGSGSASYNSSTGEFSLTLSAGQWLEEGSYDPLLANLGFNISDLDNSAGGSSKTVSVTLGGGSSGSGTSMDISTLSGAASALTSVKSSITQLAKDRATIGANITRLNYTRESLSTLKDNLTAANSRIKDVDVAEESTQYARANILVQSGTAMLAQANTMPNSLMRLLS